MQGNDAGLRRSFPLGVEGKRSDLPKESPCLRVSVVRFNAVTCCGSRAFPLASSQNGLANRGGRP